MLVKLNGNYIYKEKLVHVVIHNNRKYYQKVKLHIFPGIIAQYYTNNYIYLFS